MTDIRQNANDFKIYVTLRSSGIVTDGITPSDIVVRYSVNGGPLILDFLTILTWQELDALDAPGVYVLTVPATWTVAIGALYVALAPVVPTLFDSIVLDTYRVVPYDTSDLHVMLSRVLGLSHENFRMDQNVYNLRGELVTARVRTYGSAADTLADISPIAEYAVASSYDGQGRLQSYTMTLV